MFKYFWYEGSDLAPFAGRIGFGLFTIQHFAMLAICAVFVAGLCLYFLGRTKEEQGAY